jgi:nitroreductase
MDVSEAIEKRKSIRRYLSTPVEEEKVHALLEAARLSPSTSNLQTWKFRAVTDPEQRRVLRGHAFNQRFVEEAPVVLVCCADLAAFKDRLRRTLELVTKGRLRPSLEMVMRMARKPGEGAEEEDRQIVNAAVNMGIAVEHMALRAVELGLGTCWVRAFHAPAVAEYLELPPELVPIALLTVGYPAEDPPARSRKPLSEIVF